MCAPRGSASSRLPFARRLSPAGATCGRCARWCGCCAPRSPIWCTRTCRSAASWRGLPRGSPGCRASPIRATASCSTSRAARCGAVPAWRWSWLGGALHRRLHSPCPATEAGGCAPAAASARDAGRRSATAATPRSSAPTPPRGRASAPSLACRTSGGRGRRLPPGARQGLCRAGGGDARRVRCRAVGGGRAAGLRPRRGYRGDAGRRRPGRAAAPAGLPRRRRRGAGGGRHLRAAELFRGRCRCR